MRIALLVAALFCLTFTVGCGRSDTGRGAAVDPANSASSTTETMDEGTAPDAGGGEIGASSGGGSEGEDGGSDP